MNNGPSAIVGLWLGHIPWVHIHAKVEEHLLNTQVLVVTQVFSKGGYYIKAVNHLGEKNLSKCLDQMYTLH